MSEDTNTPFSRRFGYRSADPEITVREDAPPWLRSEVVQIARDLAIPRELPMSPEEIRAIVCQTLHCDPSGWRNAWDEVVELLRECEWPKVYEIAEALYKALDTYRGRRATEYEKQLNNALEDGGIGWQMKSGRFVVRGSEPFEMIIREAPAVLEDHGRPTAAGEIHEALRDLSRRPKSDLSGAIHHAMAALECVVRDLSGESGPTLGDLLKRHGQALGIVPPLDQALIKLWGYASERGRHLHEGREPGFEEAELVVSVASAASVYLSKRNKR